jgi:hypothetical protein
MGFHVEVNVFKDPRAQVKSETCSISMTLINCCILSLQSSNYSMRMSRISFEFPFVSIPQKSGETIEYFFL